MNWLLFFPFAIFSIGLFPLFFKRNLLQVFIGIVILFESSHLLFLSLFPGNSITQYFVLVSMMIEVTIFSLFLFFLFRFYKKEKSLSLESLRND